MIGAALFLLSCRLSKLTSLEPIATTAERQALDEDQAANPEAFGAVSGMRLRTLPVFGALPSIFGMTMAAHVLCELAGKSYSSMQAEPISVKGESHFPKSTAAPCLLNFSPAHT